MSGFQIPGLGFAKPGEKLPPLRTDQSITPVEENAPVSKEQPAAPATEQTIASAAQTVTPTIVQPTTSSTDNQIATSTPTEQVAALTTGNAATPNLVEQVAASSSTDHTAPPTEHDTTEHDTTSTEQAAPNEQTNEAYVNGTTTGPTASAVDHDSNDMQIDSDQPTAKSIPDDAPDSMVIDRPESPPSLTDALIASLGGIDSADATPAQVEPQIIAPSEPPTENVAGTNDGDAEHPEWEADSSPYESSSESSTDSSDDDSDNEDYELLGVEETARMLMEAEGGSDDEGGRAAKPLDATQMRTQNEMPDEIIPRPDVTITPEMEIEELGTVEHIVENIAVIKAITSGQYQVLDTGSVLCTADRAVVGAVAETIGKVVQPLYTVHFTSSAEIEELGLATGTKICYPVDHASYVFTEPLIGVKGTDASNAHDEEVGDEEMDFSDDEKEAEYKRAMKQKKRDKWKVNNPEAAARGRGGRESHPPRQETSADTELNYDDGPYKPLTRPPGFGSGPVSEEPYPSHSRSDYSRARRANFLNRGSQGRGGRGGGPSRDGYSLPPQGATQQQQDHNYQAPPPAPQHWNNTVPPAQGQGTVPAMPNFGFQLPGWPQQPAAQTNGQAPAVPPPPPGWQGTAPGQTTNSSTFNPALIAALMSHMQSQGGQQQWGGQNPPPPPPPSGGY